MYGIFYERNRHFEGTGYRAGRWPWRVGRYQPAGRLRQRQPWREIAGHEAAYGRRRCCPDWDAAYPSAGKPVRLRQG